MTLEHLDALARTIATMPVAGDAMPVSLPAGVTREGDDPFVLRFDPPVDAITLVGAFGWSRAYACSGDVHQRSWHVALYAQDCADEHHHRIAVETPRTGDWLVRAELDARPEGELPGLVAGAAPAYPLDRYAARVTRLVLEAVEI